MSNIRVRFAIVAMVVAVLSLCAVFAWVLAAQKPKAKQCEKATETKLTMQQLPAKVQQSLLKAVGKTGKVDEIEKCVAGKVVTYSADVTKDGKKFEVEIAADGKLIKQKEEKPKAAGVKGKGEADEADDVKVELSDLPQAVRDTLLQQVGTNGKIEGIEKEDEDGQVVFSADVTKDGKQYDIKIAPDGKLIKVEEEKPGESEGVKGKGEADEENEAAEGQEGNEVKVELADLPQAVRDTLMAQVGENGKVEGVEKEVLDGKTVYSADVTKADGKQYDIVIAEDGTLVSTEMEKAGEKEGAESAAGAKEGTEKDEAGEKE